MYRTITEIKRANKERGYFWFSPATLRHFRSVVYPTLYAGRYFITSEQMDDAAPRRYAIREALNNGQIGTVSKDHESHDAAVAAIRRLLNG